MDCQECPEGYKVSYTPMAPGNYLISIKYGGPQHIVGSPFKAKISGWSENLIFSVMSLTSSEISDWISHSISDLFAGPRLSGGHSLHETSSVLVETVSKTSAMGGVFASLPKFSSDASKAISRGAGLSKAFIGQKNSFTVDCSKAGEEVRGWIWNCSNFTNRNYSLKTCSTNKVLQKSWFWTVVLLSSHPVRWWILFLTLSPSVKMFYVF